MQEHIAIGMPAQTLVVSDGDPANLQRNPGAKLMRIKPVADAGRWPFVVGRWHFLIQC
jgi:hypothetical protein